MKKVLLKILAALVILAAPIGAIAAYGLTQSPLLVASTPSYFETNASIASLNITGDITLEAWIKITSLPADRGAIIGRNSAVAYQTYNFEIEKSGANYNLRLVRSLAGTPTTICQKSSWNPSTGVWYHVAATHVTGSGACEIIIDGSVAGSGTTAGSADGSNEKTNIGAAGFGAYFDGRVSLARVWNTVRSAATINANKCNVYGTATTNMQAEWSLDNVLTDASGNGSTLTNIGSVAFAVDTPAACASAATAASYVNALVWYWEEE